MHLINIHMHIKRWSRNIKAIKPLSDFKSISNITAAIIIDVKGLSDRFQLYTHLVIDVCAIFQRVGNLLLDTSLLDIGYLRYLDNYIWSLLSLWPLLFYRIKPTL